MNSAKAARRLLLIAFICICTSVFWISSVSSQSGGSFDVQHTVVSGGGGRNTGSNLQNEGTIGQPAAGTQMSGGNFSQSGLRTQTTGGPFSAVGGYWFAAVPQPSPESGAGTFAFSLASYSVNEDCTEAVITVKRSSGNTGPVTVDFATTSGIDYVPCNQNTGAGAQNCDFGYATGTLNFKTGDTFQSFSVLISKDAYSEGPETVNLQLTSPTGGSNLGAQSAATLTIIDNPAVPTTTQPMDDAQTFVGQTYHDFLARQADPDGQAYWASQITQCGVDQACVNGRRIDVSNAFFFELEYQQTGAYVYRLYRAAFGNTQPFPNGDPANQTEANKVPAYSVFLPDRARVVGGASLAQAQLDLANLFVRRPAFLTKYPASLDGPSFIDAVLATIKNDMGADLTSQKPQLLTLFNSGGRGAVIYRLADDNAATNPINNQLFINAEYNRAFVTTQYFGYLRRDSDIRGFLFWLDQVNHGPLRDVAKQHAMVCSFITSAEYQNRFSVAVTHTNAECSQ